MMRDPRWERVSGGITHEDTLGHHRRLEISVRVHQHKIGRTTLLRDDHPAEFPYALDETVRAIDEVLHS